MAKKRYFRNNVTFLFIRRFIYVVIFYPGNNFAVGLG